MKPLRRTVRILLCASVVSAGLAGCAKEEDQPKILEMAGTVEKINLKERKVTVSTFIEKFGRSEDFEVNVTDETEIIINGRLAKLEEVKVGERAEGSVRVVKDGEEKHYVAMQVEIERSEAIVAPGSKNDGSRDEDSGEKPAE